MSKKSQNRNYVPNINFCTRLEPEDFLSLFLFNLKMQSVYSFNEQYLQNFIIECIKAGKYIELFENFPENPNEFNDYEIIAKLKRAIIDAKSFENSIYKKETDTPDIYNINEFPLQKDYSYFNRSIREFTTKYLNYVIEKKLEDSKPENISKSL